MKQARAEVRVTSKLETWEGEFHQREAQVTLAGGSFSDAVMVNLTLPAEVAENIKAGELYILRLERADAANDEPDEG
jgi:hypothetical protein